MDARRWWPGVLRWPTVGSLLVAGLLLREAFSFWTGHPYDLEAWVRTGYVVARGTNPYVHFWPAVPGVSFGYIGQDLPPAAYLPFWPDIFGGTYWLWEHVGGGNRFFLYFLLKQGPIAGDAAVAFLLYRFVFRETSDRATALAALSFWTFFPYDILIGAIWGQVDSVTTGLLLAVLLTSEARAARRSIAWGVGIFVKWITIIFLPFELFRQRGVRRLWPLVGLLVAGGLTLVAFVGAGWGVGTVVATSTSETGGGGGGMNYAQLFSLWFLRGRLASVPVVYSILVYLWIPGVIIAGAIAARWVRTGDSGQEVRALLFVTTVLLLLRWGLYEQYFLYPFALLVADVYARHPLRRRFFYYLVGVASAFLIVNDVLGIWFASPVSGGAFDFVQGVDSSPVTGPVRYDLLDALAVLTTISLVQMLCWLYRDDPDPTPWVYRLWPSRSRGPQHVDPLPVDG